ncbi:hypothetical protein SNEBB_008046 [Seison nebaliae]|nr:hypothetical protein SNEBB_008046 [Seison nebaliae]
MISKGFGKLKTKNTLLFICDLQGKFAKHSIGFNDVVHSTNRIIKSAEHLQLPIIATEQVPKALGRLVDELKLPTTAEKFEKFQFSMLTDDIRTYLDDNHKNYESIILCGIEAHVCIYQTVMDLVEEGKEVYIPVDCVTSRSLTDRKYALKSFDRVPNVHLGTGENIIFRLMISAKHPKFREISPLFKEATRNNFK